MSLALCLSAVVSVHLHPAPLSQKRFRENQLQLLPAEGLAERLKKSSEEYGIFFYFGLLSAGMIAIFGFLAPFFPVWPSTGVRVVILCGEFLTVSANRLFHS